ncbi:hypothetical protein HED50_08410 [Ochrobactrum oryzae]|nr:hypothetical protein [Brucella oryzae]
MAMGVRFKEKLLDKPVLIAERRYGYLIAVGNKLERLPRIAMSVRKPDETQPSIARRMIHHVSRWNPALFYAFRAFWPCGQRRLVSLRAHSLFIAFSQAKPLHAFAENALDNCVDKRPVSGAGHDHGKQARQ